MNHHIRLSVLLLIIACSPVSVSADIIESDPDLTAFTSFSTQLFPQVTDFDDEIDGLGTVQALTRVEGALAMPFPNIPTSQTQAFASSTGTLFGVFGVGVNGFFFQNSLPRHSLVASGTFNQTLTNNSAVGTPLVPIVVDFFIPRPTIQFFGVGKIAVGVNPLRDAEAGVNLTMRSKVTHLNGSFVEDIVLDYGMTVSRETLSGVLLAFPNDDAVGLVSQFDVSDGSFGFELPTVTVVDVLLADLGPGDILEFSYEYSVFADTGFGETGVFAAIGDPFDLSASGGRIELRVVPEPATWTLLAAGLLAAAFRLPAISLHHSLDELLL